MRQQRTDEIGREAHVPNPALKALAFLVGTWRTEGTHPALPDKTFHGRTVFEWSYGGAFLVMRSEIDEPEIPSGIAIFASDAANGPWSMLYFDERGVSRRYVVTVGPNELHCVLDDPAFSQTREFAKGPDGNVLSSRGRYREHSGEWQEDLTLIYRREEST